MRYKILFSIIGIVLLLGLVVAGGVALTQRDATLTTAQKNALISKGVTDIKTTKMVCNDEYCTFWITKDNVINSQRHIEKFKTVCEDKIVEIKPEECTKDEMRLDEKKVCWETICNQVLKTEKEMLDERTSITDKAISSVADSIIIDNTKSEETSIGTDEEVLIK